MDCSPPAPPACNVFQNRGAPPAPWLGDGGHAPFLGLGARSPEAPLPGEGKRGTPCTPGGGCAPCTLNLGARMGFVVASPSFSGVGLPQAPTAPCARPPTFLETVGTSPCKPGLFCGPCTLLEGNEGFVVACVLRQRGDGLALTALSGQASPSAAYVPALSGQASPSAAYVRGAVERVRRLRQLLTRRH